MTEESPFQRAHSTPLSRLIRPFSGLMGPKDPLLDRAPNQFCKHPYMQLNPRQLCATIPLDRHP